MAHTIDNQKPLLNRVKRIQGQLAGLQKSLEAGTDCSDVLQQIAAVRGAVNGLMTEVLEGHLRTHLVPVHNHGGDELEDLIKVLRSYMR